MASSHSFKSHDLNIPMESPLPLLPENLPPKPETKAPVVESKSPNYALSVIQNLPLRSYYDDTFQTWLNQLDQLDTSDYATYEKNANNCLVNLRKMIELNLCLNSKAAATTLEKRIIAFEAFKNDKKNESKSPKTPTSVKPAPQDLRKKISKSKSSKDLKTIISDFTTELKSESNLMLFTSSQINRLTIIYRKMQEAIETKKYKEVLTAYASYKENTTHIPLVMKFLYAEAFFHENDFVKALEVITQIISIDNKYTDAYFLRSVIYLSSPKLEDIAKGRAAFRAALNCGIYGVRYFPASPISNQAFILFMNHQPMNEKENNEINNDNSNLSLLNAHLLIKNAEENPFKRTLCSVLYNQASDTLLQLIHQDIKKTEPTNLALLSADPQLFVSLALTFIRTNQTWWGQSNLNLALYIVKQQFELKKQSGHSDEKLHSLYLKSIEITWLMAIYHALNLPLLVSQHTAIVIKKIKALPVGTHLSPTIDEICNNIENALKIEDLDIACKACQTLFSPHLLSKVHPTHLDKISALISKISILALQAAENPLSPSAINTAIPATDPSKSLSSIPTVNMVGPITDEKTKPFADERKLASSSTLSPEQKREEHLRKQKAAQEKKAEEKAKAAAEREAKTVADRKAKAAAAELRAKAATEREAKAIADRQAKAAAELRAKAATEREAKAIADRQAKIAIEREAKATAEREARATAELEMETKKKSAENKLAKQTQARQALAVKKAEKREQKAKIKAEALRADELARLEAVKAAEDAQRQAAEETRIEGERIKAAEDAQRQAAEETRIEGERIKAAEDAQRQAAEGAKFQNTPSQPETESVLQTGNKARPKYPKRKKPLTHHFITEHLIAIAEKIDTAIPKEYPSITPPTSSSSDTSSTLNLSSSSDTSSTLNLSSSSDTSSTSNLSSSSDTSSTSNLSSNSDTSSTSNLSSSSDTNSSSSSSSPTQDLTSNNVPLASASNSSNTHLSSEGYDSFAHHLLVTKQAQFEAAVLAYKNESGIALPNGSKKIITNIVFPESKDLPHVKIRDALTRLELIPGVKKAFVVGGIVRNAQLGINSIKMKKDYFNRDVADIDVDLVAGISSDHHAALKELEKVFPKEQGFTVTPGPGFNPPPKKQEGNFTLESDVSVSHKEQKISATSTPNFSGLFTVSYTNPDTQIKTKLYQIINSKYLCTDLYSADPLLYEALRRDFPYNALFADKDGTVYSPLINSLVAFCQKVIHPINKTALAAVEGKAFDEKKQTPATYSFTEDPRRIIRGLLALVDFTSEGKAESAFQLSDAFQTSLTSDLHLLIPTKPQSGFTLKQKNEITQLNYLLDQKVFSRPKKELISIFRLFKKTGVSSHLFPGERKFPNFAGAPLEKILFLESRAVDVYIASLLFKFSKKFSNFYKLHHYKKNFLNSLTNRIILLAIEEPLYHVCFEKHEERRITNPSLPSLAMIMLDKITRYQPNIYNEYSSDFFNASQSYQSEASNYPNQQEPMTAHLGATPGTYYDYGIGQYVSAPSLNVPNSYPTHSMSMSAIAKDFQPTQNNSTSNYDSSYPPLYRPSSTPSITSFSNIVESGSASTSTILTSRPSSTPSITSFSNIVASGSASTSTILTSRPSSTPNPKSSSKSFSNIASGYSDSAQPTSRPGLFTSSSNNTIPTYVSPRPQYPTSTMLTARNGNGGGASGYSIHFRPNAQPLPLSTSTANNSTTPTENSKKRALAT